MQCSPWERRGGVPDCHYVQVARTSGFEVCGSWLLGASIAPTASAAQQLEGVVRSPALKKRHVNPEHGEGLEQARVRQGADVDRVKSRIGDEALDCRLRRRVIAAIGATTALAAARMFLVDR